MDTFFNLLFSGLETGSQYALAALGIVLIYRTSVMTNFAQGTLGMFNGFIATVAASTWGIPPWAAAIVGMITAIISGI
jgi:branched-chain amino acid transport system permease protein